MDIFRGESWNAWAASKILTETGGFPVFSRGPLYIVYLVPFQFFSYPEAIKIEYFVTHLLMYLVLFSFINIYLNILKSIILTLALIPIFSTIEGGAIIFSLIFFTLYLKNMINKGISKFPIYIILASLSHSVYWPFLICHGIYSLMIYLRGIDKRQAIYWIFFLLIIYLILLNQSTRSDNNHTLGISNYFPVEFNSAINIGFFQIKTWALSELLNPVESLYKLDWYFQTPLYFGNSRNIIDLVKNDSSLFLSMFLLQIEYIVTLPLYFLIFHGLGNIKILYLMASISCCILFIYGFLKLKLNSNGWKVIILIGMMGDLSAFLLTQFTPRYVIAIYPIFLMVYLSLYKNLNLNLFFSQTKSIIKNSIFYLILFLIMLAAPFRGDIYKDNLIINYNSVNDSNIFKFKFIAFFQGYKHQFISLFHDFSFLNDHRFKITKTIPIINGISNIESLKVMGLEHTFYMAFTKIGINNIIQLWQLPPYSIPMDNHLLDEVDLFIISNKLTNKEPDMSTQSYLRYELNIRPHLILNADKYNIINIEDFGYLYLKNK